MFLQFCYVLLILTAVAEYGLVNARDDPVSYRSSLDCVDKHCDHSCVYTSSHLHRPSRANRPKAVGPEYMHAYCKDYLPSFACQTWLHTTCKEPMFRRHAKAHCAKTCGLCYL
ncbi:hypothetical protein Y032_0274g1015 [Ancylostoma ceylanicum]|nr:hypothetical protein Y032_0274g1015 [Ancylostoma ceylanicum]